MSIVFGGGPVPRDWQCPAEEAKDDTKLGWINSAVEQGDTFLKSQRAYRDIDNAVEFIAGTDEDELPESYSRIQINRGKRQIKEFIATFSNIQPSWGFTTDDDEMISAVDIQNHMMRGWYNETFADRWFNEMYSVGTVKGTVYVWPKWDPHFHAYYRGDIALEIDGPEDVLPIQIGTDNDLQKAYAVVRRIEVPIAQAWAMFPTKTHLITADREAPSGMKRVLSRIKQRFASPALNVGGTGRGGAQELTIFPMVDLYCVYVRDMSVNKGTQSRLMGDPGASWSYTVPALRSDLPTGVFDSAGREYTRKSNEEDCMLYPRRRVMWATSTHMLSDGPSRSWFPGVPVIKFCPDGWPWEYLGYSLTRDIGPMQETVRSILRAIVDQAKARLQPALAYSDGVSQTLMEDLDPRQPGQSIQLNMAMGDEIKALLDPRFYETPEHIFALVDKILHWMDHQLGTPEVAQLAKLKQLPASDSIDKILEAGGPLIMDIARNIERLFRDLGNMWLSLSMQHYTTKRKVIAIGEDGMPEAPYLYDPDKAIPSHMPNEDTSKPSRHSPIERGQFWMNRMRFLVTENSQLAIKQKSRQLFIMMAKKNGFPIDWWTEAEAYNFSNFGPPPKGAHTMLEKYIAQKHIEAELAQEIGVQVQQSQPGRPNSGNAPPQQKVKQGANGQRVTNQTSR